MRSFAILLVACGSDPVTALPDSPPAGDSAPDSPVPPPDAGLSPLIVFQSSNDIFVMEPDGSNPQNLTNTVSIIETDPAWSPDKTKIAFRSDRDDVGEIYVMNADGSNLVRLTFEVGENDAQPAWSPDGTKIAFASRRDHLITSIYVMNADGTDVQRITNLLPASDDFPSWSPDGTKIAFSTNEDNNLHVATVDANGANRTRVTPNTESAVMPAWSPDGTKIAFSLAGQIHVIAPDGTGQMQITTPSTQAENRPAWSRDGLKLAFDRNVSGVTHIFAIGANGANELDLAGPTGAPIDPAF